MGRFCFIFPFRPLGLHFPQEEPVPCTVCVTKSSSNFALEPPEITRILLCNTKQDKIAGIFSIWFKHKESYGGCWEDQKNRLRAEFLGRLQGHTADPAAKGAAASVRSKRLLAPPPSAPAVTRCQRRGCPPATPLSPGGSVLHPKCFFLVGLKAPTCPLATGKLENVGSFILFYFSWRRWDVYCEEL